MRIFLSLYGKDTRLVRAFDEADARAQLLPMYDGFQPDLVRDVTEVLESDIGNFIQQARDRVGSGAESRFRYAVGTLLSLYRGEPAPDDADERYAREWQAHMQTEAALASLTEELASTKEALALAQAAAPVSEKLGG